MTRWIVGGLIGGLMVTVAIGFASDVPVDVRDQTGAAVTIPQPIERVASVYGAGTFIVYALGASDRLAMAWYIGVKGIGQASEAMFRLEPRLADILSFGDPNLEEMVRRDVQLVLVDGSRHSGFADQMMELGVPVLRFLVETPEALMDAVRMVGAALGTDAAARAAAFLGDYDRVSHAVVEGMEARPSSERVRVLFVGTDPLTVASGDMYQTHLIEAAGGTSVAADLVGYWNEINLEQVLLWNPDVILIAPYGPVQPADILENPDWQAITAIHEGRVHRVPRLIAPWDTPVPESLLGIAWMADVLHPEMCAIDLEDEVLRFYAEYYGYPLSDEELAHLLSR